MMASLPRQAFIGVGANLGDRAATLAAAAARLRALSTISLVETSSLYETDPIGELNQPLFLNQVIGIETILSPEFLLRELMEIEQEFGRVRVQRWGPRTLDLDLLAYEGETRDSAELQLPHPRMWSRAFVTVPLRELLRSPTFRKREWDGLRNQLSAAVGFDGVRRLESE